MSTRVVAEHGGGPWSARTRRLELGLTIKQLAQCCTAAGVKVSASEISRIERRIHAPRPALRKTLAGVLGMTVTDFDFDLGEADV